jgi:hypothetical protein
MKKFLKRIKWKLFRPVKTNKDVFSRIYDLNSWSSGKSVSGPGSEIDHTMKLIKALPEIFSKFNIRTVLDAPCGDYNWMKLVSKDNISYTGGDIVKKIIDDNNRKYKTPIVNFIELDIINDKLPRVDLLIIRDCFIHFSDADLKKAIKNIVSSGAEYLFTTSYINSSSNSDIKTGQWRRLNLLAPQFSFPEPDLTFMEESTEQNNRFPDKAMLLWKISRLEERISDF